MTLTPKDNFHERPHQYGTRDYTHGRVYFITDGELIKIGYSGAPEVRLKGLQSDSGRELKIIRTIPGTYEDEDRLHAQFSHLRVRGEWFRSDPELLDFIADRPRVVSAEPFERAKEQFATLSKSEKWPPEVALYFGSIECILGRLIEQPDDKDARRSLTMATDGLEANMAWWRRRQQRVA